VTLSPGYESAVAAAGTNDERSTVRFRRTMQGVEGVGGVFGSISIRCLTFRPEGNAIGFGFTLRGTGRDGKAEKKKSE
jgi:hypothetical protein